MSEMIDRVAEAIALAGNGGTWDDWYNPEQKEFHRKRARAAFEAIREPTQKMRLAGISEWSRPDPTTEHENPTLVFNVVWRAMIDAAISEGK